MDLLYKVRYLVIVAINIFLLINFIQADVITSIKKIDRKGVTDRFDIAIDGVFLSATALNTNC